MEKIINFLNRANRFKVVMALIACLLFLIPPSCEKDALIQDPLLTTDKISVSAAAASSSAIMYWGRRNYTSGGGDEQICRPWFENFGNFVLKVQNVNGGAAKISALEVRIDGVLILTAKGLSRDYLVTKALRSLSNCARLTVNMSGDQGCSVDVWIEGTLNLGNVYGRHFYYKPRQPMTWDETLGYRWSFPGFPYPVIINDVRENTFLLNSYKEDNRNFFIGLSDWGHEMRWEWVDGSSCRTVIWNTDVCGWPNQECPGAPIPWGWYGCTIITDFGYNNWSFNEPNNGGGGCDQPYHRDENVAILDGNGKWDDVPSVPGTWDGIHFDDARRNCVLEWNSIPSSSDKYIIFRQEFPDYANEYPN